ncbi:MAG TPA: MarR family winged helix-turn-helix transcriptional regulator [Geminicoccaceae bacterium]
MLRRTARRVTQAYDAALRPAGLRLTQYSILANLDRAPGSTITGLAERLVMDRTTLTRNLRPLERAGWVARGPGADPRARTLALTAAGRATVERARPLWQAAERSFRARLGPERAGALRDLLDEAAQAAEGP